MVDDRKEKFEGWLKSQGYPLEMLVARAFSDAGFFVQQSVWYTDPQEGKPRELDILATKNSDFFAVNDLLGAVVNTTIVIECKRLHEDNAWIMFMTGEPRASANLSAAEAALHAVTIQYFHISGNRSGETLLHELRAKSPHVFSKLGWLVSTDTKLTAYGECKHL